MIHPPPRDTPNGQPVIMTIHYPGGRKQEIEMQDAAAAERYYIALVNGPDEPKPIGWRTRPCAGG